MFTSNYNNFKIKDYRLVSISGDSGKEANYEGECYSDLAPKKEFWQIWHNNIGKISEEENNKYYVTEYYKQVLSNLNPDTVYNDLKDKILLCYEQPNEFCHRTIVAYWFEILFGTEVFEIETDHYSFASVERDNQQWIKSYLEEVMIENTPNMRGFNSLMGLRLFEKGETYDENGYLLEENAKKMRNAAKELETVDKIMSDELYSRANILKERALHCHLEASGLRCQADDAEQECLEKISSKLLVKYLGK